MVSTNSRKKGNWYIAIARDCNGSYNFYTGEDANRLKSFLSRRNLEIVAEQEGLTEKEMDRIIGYKIISSDDGMLREENTIKVGREYLNDLTVKLNQDKELEPKTELEKLYRMIKE